MQCARYPQLANVLFELLGFKGSEFYFDHAHASRLEGLCFGQLQRLYPLAVPTGIMTADGKLVLNPPGDYVLQLGESQQSAQGLGFGDFR